MKIIAILDNPAPHCDKSYFGFLFSSVYPVTDNSAAAVDDNAEMTVLLLYMEEINPTIKASVSVKMVNKFHFKGEDCLARSETDMKRTDIVDTNKHRNGTAMPLDRDQGQNWDFWQTQI